MVSIVASQQKGSGFETRSFCLTSGGSCARYPAGVGPVCMEFACSLMSVLVPSGYSGFVPQSKDMQVGLIGDCKLPVGMNVSVNGCLSLYVSPAVNCQLVQGCTLPSSTVSWD